MTDRARPSGDPGPPGGTVLVVDDEADVRHVVRLMLRRAGHEVVEAEDGEAAVGIIRERGDDVDAVLLDVMMPRMTGHEALPAIRELQPGMPVVFFTGYDQSEVAEHLGPEGVHTSFLAKPFDRDDLLAAIADAVAASPRRGGDAGAP